MKTKSIHYAYPTSTMAVQFSFGKTGCYYLVLSNVPSYFKDLSETYPIVGTDKNAVLDQSAQYDFPWGHYSMYNDVDGWKDELGLTAPHDNQSCQLCRSSEHGNT